MLARVTNALLAWQSNPEKIENLLSRKAKPEEILSAKKLFNKLILSPNQLSIHTIHSFCQKILQKFPFEAGVDPGFKVLSDTETKELCDKVISEISDELQLDNKINESFFYILKNIHELTFASLVMEILADQIDFRDLFSKYESSKDYEDFLKKKLRS
jgi:ATP-dependent helicase/nuclease subunit A